VPKKSFPIFIDYSEFFGLLNQTNFKPYGSYGYDNIHADVFNPSNITLELKMGETEANALIQKRKSPNGDVNRKFLAKVEYSIMNLKSQVQTTNLVVYIHKISVSDGSTVLKNITPNEDYYDKVNGLKLKDGTEKIFFDKDWKELRKEDSLAASFYRIVNYKAGKIYNPVIDYYISGSKQMEGNYSVNLQTKDGLFQWFYENGQRSEMVKYSYERMNGQYLSWYQNGDSKEDVKYIYGKKDGCDKMWAENGKCLEHGLIAAWSYTDKYFSFYQDGKPVDRSTKCPCVNRPIQNKNDAGNKINEINFGQIIGKYEGIIDAIGSSLIINADSSFVLEEKRENGKILTHVGRVTLEKKVDIDYYTEDSRNSIKNRLSNNAEYSDYGIRLSYTFDNKTQTLDPRIIKDSGHYTLRFSPRWCMVSTHNY